MQPKLVSLDVVDVASPCQVPWESMTGDDQVRYCGECQLNVYNLSDMTRNDALALVNSREGRLCVRFFRRPDGTVLTQDCPVGLRAVRRRIARLVAGIAAMVSFLAAGFAVARSIQNSPASGQSNRGPLMRIAEWIDPPAPLMGKFSAVAGDVCIAPPPPITSQAPPTPPQPPSGE